MSTPRTLTYSIFDGCFWFLLLQTMVQWIFLHLSSKFVKSLSPSSNTKIVVLVAKSCPPLCNRMDCSPPGSCVHRISQARILEGVAISFSRGSSRPRDRTHVSYTGRWILYYMATREAYTQKLALMNNIFLLSKDFETKSSIFNCFPPLALLSWGINSKWMCEFLNEGSWGNRSFWGRKPVNIWAISCYT